MAATNLGKSQSLGSAQRAFSNSKGAVNGVLRQDHRMDAGQSEHKQKKVFARQNTESEQRLLQEALKVQSAGYMHFGGGNTEQ